MRLQTFISTLTAVAAFTLTHSQAIAQSVTTVYDALNRVTSVQSTAGTVALSQDPAGNLTSRGFTPVATAPSGLCGAANGVLSVTRPAAFLCAAGQPSAVSSFSVFGLTWAWTCQGSTNASCSARAEALDHSICSNILPVAAAVIQVGGTASFNSVCGGLYPAIWWLDGVRLTACDGLSTCAVTFPVSGLRVLTIASSPTAPTSAQASLVVEVTPLTSCTAITGANTVATGLASTYTSTCGGTATRVWKLNGTQIAVCNDQVTCAVTMTTLGTNSLTVAPTATSAANITATLSVTASAPAATCSELTGSNVAPAAGASQSYTGICTNASSYVWKLGSTTLGCTTATCTVSIAANAAPTQVLRTLTVAPSTATSSTAALVIAQAPAAVPPQCSGSVTGQTAYPYTGGSSAYAVSCTGASSVSWVLGGIAQSCAGTSCTVVVPANTVTSALNLSLAVTATNLNGSTNLPALAITVAAAPACSLDFNGDSAVNTTDALIFSRWLLGFRGDSLVAGITPFPAGTATSAFAAAVTARMQITSAHDFDQNTAVDAATDGLIFLRLTLGMRDAALTNGALGAGAQRNTYSLIRGHMLSACGVTYPP